MSPGQRKEMINRNHDTLSLSAQCRVLNISRSTLCYRPMGESAETLSLMKAIDKLFTKYPFFGSRQIASWLARDGIKVGRHRVRRLMRLMGLEAVYKRPKTSKPHPAHPVFPYLLKGMEITQPNQVWCSDITFIPVSRGIYISSPSWIGRREKCSVGGSQIASHVRHWSEDNGERMQTSASMPCKKPWRNTARQTL